MGSVDLKVDWCSHEAAKYAVMHWHYSRRMPVFKLRHIGVWESGEFVGAVLFGYGATPSLAKWLGLTQQECAELVRVALKPHSAQTTQIVAAAVNLLRRNECGLRAIVSFADTRQGHVGTIYQAMNWVFTGTSRQTWLRVCGEDIHPKTLHSRYGVGGQSIQWLRQHVDPGAERIDAGSRHRYVLPLDKAMRRQVEKMRKPYPKRATRAAADIDGAPLPEEQGGAEPTRPLQN